MPCHLLPQLLHAPTTSSTVPALTGTISGEYFTWDIRHLVAGAFTHFFLPATMGIHFVAHLSPWAAEKCHYFEKLHAKWHDDVAFTLLAILDKAKRAFMAGLDRIHRSEHVRMTSLVVLSKIAYLIRKYKNSNAEDYTNGPCIQGIANRFTGDELEQLWRRFETLDSKLQSDTEQYEPLFQSAPMRYFFYDMPANFGINDFIASWAW